MRKYNKLREKLASLEHEQWMSWARSMLADVNVKLDPKRVERWAKCLVPYSKLSEEMKDLDRIWADKVLMLVIKDGE